MGYVTTVSILLLSMILSPFEWISTKLRYLAEGVLCYSIRFLLWSQPWLKCHHNFQPIFGFYDQYKTRKVMFVANHRSNLDTFLLISLIPGLRGLAKSSLFYNIFFAPIMLLIGFAPVKKGSIDGFLVGLKMLKTKILDRNRAVLIFPETTRCEKNFSSIQKFSSAVFDVAIESSALVVPIFIQDTDQSLGRGDLLLNPYNPLAMKIFSAIQTSDFKNATELSKHVRNLFLNEQVNLKPLCN
jgi:1-acyl-sn-glycerol-3-phosphate acyltransferase